MSTIDTIRYGLASSRSRVETRKSIGYSVTGLARLISRWGERHRTRRALLALNDDQLKDIGISRADAHREGTTSFWR
ncbi:MAG: DUF1127 domain-containing protein [Notoacmeibacter sp.]|nr:DUF1127 domain-containing protein [Notoacmeibacter sp.]